MSCFEPFPILATDRFKLRAPSPEDADAVFAIFRDEEVTRYHDSPTYLEREQADGWIARRAQAFANGRAVRWMIARQEDDWAVGSCGFGSWDKEAHSAEIGYELSRASWGQGIMTEALTTILAFGFNTMDLHRVIAQVMLDNAASIRLLTNLGFHNEGTLKQHGFWKGEHHDLYQFALEKH